MSALRVAHVVINSMGGGAERVAGMICAELAAAGHEPLLLPIDPEPVLQGDAFAVDALTPRRLPTPRRELQAGLVLHRRLSAFDPHVVHLHCEAPEVVGSLAMLGRTSAAVVVSEHIENPWQRRAWLGNATRRYLNRRGAYWVRCHPDAGLNRHGEDVPVIGNPIRPIPVAPLPDLDLPLRRLLVVQRLLRHKGAHRVLVAAAQIGWTGPVVLVGAGGEQPSLRALADELGLDVEFRGFEREPWNVVAAGDLLLSASEHEGEPLGILEAISLNLPVLLSDISGHQNLVQRPDQLFSDDAGLVRALGQVVEGRLPLRVLQPGPVAAAELRDERSPSTIASAWLRLYQQLAAVPSR